MAFLITIAAPCWPRDLMVILTRNQPLLAYRSWRLNVLHLEYRLLLQLSSLSDTCLVSEADKIVKE